MVLSSYTDKTNIDSKTNTHKLHKLIFYDHGKKGVDLVCPMCDNT